MPNKIRTVWTQAEPRSKDKEQCFFGCVHSNEQKLKNTGYKNVSQLQNYK